MKPVSALFALATSVILSLSVAGCAAVESEPKPAATDPSIPAELTKFYQQQVKWSGCEGYLKCGEVEVPLDWQNPTGDTIQLAVIYRPADSSDPIGSLLVNPGGPGSSAHSWLALDPEGIATEEIRESFNIVAFDPRGVGRSAAVKCFDDAGTDRLLYEDNGEVLGSDADIAETRELLKEFASACEENTGPLLGEVDTVSAARDMDVIRAVMGDSKLNYLGYSYGTFLGNTFATLFPERVGRLVLDGAIDPTVSEEQQSINQLVGFDEALAAFIETCIDDRSCPLTGSVENGQRQISDFLKQLETTTLPTDDGRDLTVWAAVTGIIMPLYSEDYWPYLSQGLTDAFAGDGSLLMLLADTYNDRGPGGEYQSNLMPANVAISCLDGRASSAAADIQAQNEKVLATSKVLGRYWQFGALTCEQWPYPVTDRPADYSAEGSAPILVIGTTGDPATPYQQAVSLANEILDNAALLTYDGEGHTIYGQGVSCIDNAVDDYLLNGKLPEANKVCD